MFKFDPARVVFEGSLFVIYDIIDLLPVHKNYPHGTSVLKPNGRPAVPSHWQYGPRRQEIRKAFIHQTAGGYAPGFEGVQKTARFITRDPSYTPEGKWRGDGRGWPAMCYSYYFPYYPERVPGSDAESKLIIFKCRPDEHRSWHTAGHNDEAIGLGFQGYFRSRHIGPFVPRHGDESSGKPHRNQRVMLISWEEFFKPTFGLTNDDVFGHFEAKRPKLSCPGDWLEDWVLQTRGKDPVFRSWESRQLALVRLGYDLGTTGINGDGVDGDPGYRTRAAIEGVEEALGLPVNGVWDESLEIRIREWLRWNKENLSG
jgi:hypothetical protein